VWQSKRGTIVVIAKGNTTDNHHESYSPEKEPEECVDPSPEREIVSKVTWRLIPLLFLCYIIAYIDRINVGFAGLQLQKAFGVDTGR